MIDIAVFVRNHAPYLDRACEISAEDPSRPVTFRSSKKWAAVKRALDKQVVVRAYLSPTGGDGQVTYSAMIKNIVLDPTRGEAETDRALANQLPETVNEDLWSEENGPIKTLYEVSHCKRLKAPFAMTALKKASDKLPISENYGYSYVPVLDLKVDVAPFSSPDEVEHPEQYPEGVSRLVSVNAIERNPKAREACLRHYGTSCCVCGFSFEKEYGELGAGFIHVHHLMPLGKIRKGYDVDPIVDLRPVCPNCHAMIHREDPPLSPEQLAKMMRPDEG